MAQMTLTSTTFEPNQPIPRRHTGDGRDASPPLAWSGAPKGTQQYALIVDDPDAPRPQPWVHWVLYAIGPNCTHLPEGIPPAQRVSEPPGLIQGVNSWDKIGYGGPAPPPGHGVHHYHFKLYALDTALKLAPGLTKEDLLKAIDGHILAEAELIGTYSRA
jgi:Raf kinase inhibitor-like YbhB/YbcL family protein